MVNMKKIEVEITGTTPLLMNSPKAMLEPTEATRKTTKKRDQSEEAEKVAYRTAKGQLFVPNTAIKGTIINAASWKKAGKIALRPLMAAGTRIEPQELILNKQKYEIDLRTVVIQRNRVVKARPKITDWKLAFTIVFNENLIPEDGMIKECLVEAGERVGILDFRPQNLGEFGCFKVTGWKVLPNGSN
jgi:hypothetical protein